MRRRRDELDQPQRSRNADPGHLQKFHSWLLIEKLFFKREKKEKEKEKEEENENRKNNTPFTMRK